METNIGNVICELRRKRGMTQEQLAEAVGVSTPAVSKWETASSCPDVALLAPIARALDTDVNTLLSFTPALSQEGLLALIKEVQQLAAQDAAAALARMHEAVRRYPTDAQLWFQLGQPCHELSLPVRLGRGGDGGGQGLHGAGARLRPATRGPRSCAPPPPICWRVWR